MGRVSRRKVNGIKNGSILFKVLLFAGIPLAIAGIAGGGILAYNATVKSEAVAQIKTEVAVTYGTPLTIDLFLNEGADRENCSFASDVSAINTDDLATYQLTINSNGYKVKTLFSVIDDVPPVATAVPQTIYVNQLPDPNDCITDLYDKTEVSVGYAEDVDASLGGPRTIGIVLTDACGNKTVVDCPFTIIDDHTGPVIEGAQDITITIGERPAYRQGVTVTDDYDPNPVLRVDTSEVDLENAGEYPVTYIAIDECGNQTVLEICVTVADVPEEGEEVGDGSGIRYNRASNTAYDNCTVEDAYAAASRVYGSICNSGMSDVMKGLKIFYWVNHNISFALHGTTQVSWAAAACQAFGRRYSSCYGQWAACKALCEVAGIPNRRVVRVSGHHTWCLCYLNNGWYHCDATQYPGAGHTFSFMMTDAEIVKAIGHHKGFSTAGLPGRSDISVQRWINVHSCTIRSGMPSPTKTPSPTPTATPSPTETEPTDTEVTDPTQSDPTIIPTDSSSSSESSDTSSESSEQQTDPTPSSSEQETEQTQEPQDDPEGGDGD